MERKLQALRQTGSASDFTAKFQQLSVRTQWGDSALTVLFYQALKEQVKDDITRGDQPTDLEDMIDTAVRINNQQFEQELEK